MSRLLEIRNLHIQHAGRSLIQGMDITVESGKVTALMGPSGSGKTLSARACMGQVDSGLRVISGTLRYPGLADPQLAAKDWLGPVVGQGNSANRQLLKATALLRGAYMSYSPQLASSALNPSRTIGAQLALAIGRREQVPTDLAGAIRESLQEVGLPDYCSKSLPSALSGGMCQRAALAIAVAPQPLLVIADEPETGLDPVLTRAVTELLLSVCVNRGCGLLLISHQDETVKRIGASIVRTRPEGQK
jgi:ABC-type glutathione transport system ATPase component